VSTDPSSTDPARDAWVVSRAYEGPNRRVRKAWFARRERLDDAGVTVDAQAESTATLLRRVSLWGRIGAQRDQRAAFVVTLEALAAKGRAEHSPVWPTLVEAVARYLRAAGAAGPVDERLVDDALHAAQRAHAEEGAAEPQTALIHRLDAATRRDPR
jgi:hypothetical protein